ncbi:lamin tail domain-containing protein [Streptomyces brasiliensis]|nr:lamin tail domain-containing protein [Streptomyces brasiliensis]
MSRTITTTLAAAAALGAAALPASAAGHGPAAPHGHSVVISGVQADSPGPDSRTSRSLNGEWIRLTNSSNRTVDLRGYTLREDRQHRTFKFSGARLAPRSSVTIHTGAGRNTFRDLYLNQRNHVWDHRRDTATLRDNHGRTVDTKSWGDRGGRGGHR